MFMLESELTATSVWEIASRTYSLGILLTSGSYRNHHHLMWGQPQWPMGNKSRRIWYAHIWCVTKHYHVRVPFLSRTTFPHSFQSGWRSCVPLNPGSLCGWSQVSSCHRHHGWRETKFGLQSQQLAQLKMQEGCSNQILPQNVTVVQGTEIALDVLSSFISSYYFIQENM